MSNTILRTQFEIKNRIPPRHCIWFTFIWRPLPSILYQKRCFFRREHESNQKWNKKIHLSQELVHVRRHETTTVSFVSRSQHFSSYRGKTRLVLAVSWFWTTPHFTFAVRRCCTRTASATAAVRLRTSVDISSYDERLNKNVSYNVALEKKNFFWTELLFSKTNQCITVDQIEVWSSWKNKESVRYRKLGQTIFNDFFLRLIIWRRNCIRNFVLLKK